MPVKRSDIGGRPTLYNEQALMPGLYVIQHKDLSGNWVDYRLTLSLLSLKAVLWAAVV